MANLSTNLAQLLRAHEANPTDVQSLIFSKDKYPADKAKSWAKAHGYKFSDVDVTDDSVRLRQRQPGAMKGFRTIEFGPGIKAVIGKSKAHKESETNTKVLQEPSSRIRITESIRILEALSDGPNGEKVYKVVLITEGLGNLRSKNFYGPEAVDSAAKVYEGKRCYINHQDEAQAETLPERDVRDLAGYYKNMSVEVIEGKKACVGELHCDLSESGRFLSEKIQSALQYQKDFPKRTQEYCGFSVNGDGDAEPKSMDVGGETMRVNYVNSFTDESESCDLVTTPARGGKAVSVIKESLVKPKENVMKNVIKALKTAFSKVTESAKNAAGEDKKPLLEVAKAITEAIKTVESEDEGKTMESEVEALFAKKEGESEADHTARMKALGKMISDKIGSEESEDEGAPKPDGDEGPAPAPKESNRKPLTADELERNTLAIKSVMRESGLPEGCYSDTKITSLAKMPFAKAKESIEGDSRLAASILRESGVEPVASLRHVAKTKEAGSRKAAFKEAFQQEGN